MLDRLVQVFSYTESHSPNANRLGHDKFDFGYTEVSDTPKKKEKKKESFIKLVVILFVYQTFLRLTYFFFTL